VYSGDTRPCEALVAAGLGATVLVHEATFGQAYAEDAKAKKHSTVPEAVDVGRRMGARAVVLTHFSQRYASRIEALEPARMANVTVAHDLMKVSFPQLAWAPAVTDPMQLLWPELDGEGEEEA